MSLKVRIANYKDVPHALTISRNIEESAIIRQTGISKRETEYIKNKILKGNAIVAFFNSINVGFSSIENSLHKYAANSGMIVYPVFRKKGISKLIKDFINKLFSYKFPIANFFSITTTPSIFRINMENNFQTVSFLGLPISYRFWKSCISCKNYKLLTLNNSNMCLCTAFLVKTNNFLKEKIVLAYSGGLDTSYCLLSLKEQGYEVFTAQVNTGGFSKLELKKIEENAYRIGSKYHRRINATLFYYDNCVKYLIFGNVLRNNIYPLSVSSERIFQAIKISEYANELDASAIGHGSTCAGNDQIRFDIAFQILCPDKRILSPIRDNHISRQEEMNYLQEHGVNIRWTKARYSINRGIWGTSVGGVETLTSDEKLPSDAYPNSFQELESKNIQLGFEEGEFISINREKSYTVNNILRLEQIASKFAIGREIHIGDTLIGIKGRVGFQASSALIIIKAHQLLEKHILTKWQVYWKEQLSNWYGIILHEAQYMDPIMRNIEAFFRDTQRRVSGEVIIKLTPYRFELIGVKSSYDLLQAQNEKYGEANEDWNAEDSKGFIKLFGKQMKMYHHINND